MGRDDRPQLRPVAPDPPDDRHPEVHPRVRPAHPPCPGQGPLDRPRRPVRAGRLLDGDRLAGPAIARSRRRRVGSAVRCALARRLRRRRDHRTRGPRFREDRRPDQARVPARPRCPPPVHQVRPMNLSIDTLTYRDVAKTIDHSLLRPELDDNFVEAGCRLALAYDVASVCVPPVHVARARAILAGSDVKVGTVVGFPHGYATSATKVAETREALENGATEIDMVL